MTSTTRFMAGWVPRSMRQTKLSYLPADCVICTQNARTADGVANNYTDLMMLPDQAFQRMRNIIGLQPMLELAPNPMKMPDVAFIVRDPRQVVVPGNHPDPKAFAREYFLINYGIMTAEQIAAEKDQNR